MKVKLMILFPLIFIILQMVPAQESPGLRTYLPSYRMKQLFPEDMSGRTAWYRMHPFSEDIREAGSTTLPVEYAMSSAELVLSHYDELYYFSVILSEQENSFLRDEQIDHLKYLQRIGGAGETGLNLCISGSSSDFMPVLRNSIKKDAFFAELKKVVREYNLGGVDLDWEFPRNDLEKEYYVQFLTELRQFCDSEKMSLSIAVSRFRSLPAPAYTLPDKIHLMTYDFYGRHSTTESTREALEYMLIRYDIPSEKLIMGIPFYGRIFDGYSPDYWKKAQSYKEIVSRNDLKPQDDEAEGYYFNGPATVEKKIVLGRELGIGGYFVWEIGQDSRGPESLTRILWKGLQP